MNDNQKNKIIKSIRKEPKSIYQITKELYGNPDFSGNSFMDIYSKVSHFLTKDANRNSVQITKRMAKNEKQIRIYRWIG